MVAVRQLALRKKKKGVLSLSTDVDVLTLDLQICWPRKASEQFRLFCKRLICPGPVAQLQDAYAVADCALAEAKLTRASALGGRNGHVTGCCGRGCADAAECKG